LPKVRNTELWFQAGQFVIEVVARRTVTLSYSAACISGVSPAPTCSELAAGLAFSGAGEGTVRGVECANANAGGCDCTFTILAAGGNTGTWSTSGTTLELVVFAGTPYETTFTTPYCVADDRLHLDATSDAAAWRGLSRILFEPINCNDGKKGIVEGLDCGFGCTKQCF